MFFLDVFGIYNALVALSLYAKVFEEAGALDKLEAFTSFNGPDFYGLPRNTSKIKLIKNQWKVPESLSYATSEIIPMFAGETLSGCLPLFYRNKYVSLLFVIGNKCVCCSIGWKRLVFRL
ncbi:hypothetical protein LOK49_LG07G02158 [Camellia lanceoleosa]|uniref:Uncharacterized protein n=1 Tax=Camellia lanceoleosa TaxID=1840588 RepID=A0ACC0H3X7_9ERIC|nr:hypothetical protein LOK49_LG07G02158 [Camellia lanceoleosa]